MICHMQADAAVAVGAAVLSTDLLACANAQGLHSQTAASCAAAVLQQRASANCVSCANHVACAKMVWHTEATDLTAIAGKQQ
jgi:hypothetical protein